MKTFQLSLVFLICAAGSFAQKADNMANNKLTDEQFVWKASRAGMKEVAMCTEATTKASSDRVKSFAEMLVRDHTSANEELKGIAEKNNIKLTADRDKTDMDKMDKNKAEWTDKNKMEGDKMDKNKEGMDMHNMSAKTGAEYDKEYMQMMVNEHNKAIELFKMESTNGKNADVKAFATKTLPTLQMHLDSAMVVQASLVKY
ncbi:MAG: DUF4142 domain-containing protein [Saprospiraceae bacterium]